VDLGFDFHGKRIKRIKHSEEEAQKEIESFDKAQKKNDTWWLTANCGSSSANLSGSNGSETVSGKTAAPTSGTITRTITRSFKTAESPFTAKSSLPRLILGFSFLFVSKTDFENKP
jgi:hypothetical protein